MVKLLLPLFLLASFCSFAQIRVTGVVVDKVTQTPLLGAAVVVLGTTNAMPTNEQGRFAIDIPTNSATLLFSFVGYASQSVTVTSSDTIKVEMKIDENLISEDFNPVNRYVGFHFSGGVQHTPVGGLLDVLFPLGQRPILQVQAGYQTNFSGNYQSHAAFKVLALLHNCYYNIDAEVLTSKIYLEDGFSFSNHKALVSYGLSPHNRVPLSFIAGLGRAERAAAEKPNTNWGYSFGLGTYLYVGIPFSAYARTTYWQQYWQFETGITTDTRRWQASLYYNKIGNKYQDVNLGIGYLIHY